MFKQDGQATSLDRSGTTASTYMQSDMSVDQEDWSQNQSVCFLSPGVPPKNSPVLICRRESWTPIEHRSEPVQEGSFSRLSLASGSLQKAWEVVQEEVGPGCLQDRDMLYSRVGLRKLLDRSKCDTHFF